MLNTVPAPSQARQPRGMVRLNDTLATGWVSWEVDNNTFYQADTFRVDFAVSALPADRGPDWFAAQPAILVEILAGFPADPENYGKADLDSLLYGLVDDVTFDPVARTITVSGRDLTSKLIDAKTIQKWPNLTASQIAEKIAAAHGLTPKVTKTTTKAGKYYEIDHVRVQTGERSVWDLLTWLAHEENFQVYVKGKELHFEPFAKPTDDPYLLKWQEPTDEQGFPVFNGTGISFSRNLTLAKDVIVEVRSWNAKNKKGFTKKAQATHNKNTVLKGAAQPYGDAQVYSYTFPGLTPDGALKKAQSLLAEITAHEAILDATLPADNILTTRNVIQVVGTGTAFDQIYYPDSLRREMDKNGGYRMTIHAKNHSPETVTQV